MADKKNERRGLGRGLSALMADVNIEPEQPSAVSQDKRSDTSLPIEKIKANPEQPRRFFSEDALQELANSIREKGVIQPLIVRPHPRENGIYEIVAGERRWRASQLAQLHDVPVVIRDMNDTEVLEIAIIENIQRSDLNAIEEAKGYKQLMERFGHTQEKLAAALSKSRSHIANLMRLLQLPQDVQDLLHDGKLTIGHARALITSDDPSLLAKKVVLEGLSVRQTEALAKGKLAEAKSNTTASSKDADTKALEGDLSATLGMRVNLAHKATSGAGKLSIQYKNLEQLDEICALLSSQRET